MNDSRPAPLRVNGGDPFVQHTMNTRQPNNLRDMLERNPDYPDPVKKAVQTLITDLVEDRPVRMPWLVPPTPDYTDWQQAVLQQAERVDTLRWQQVEWFFAETYLFRRVVEVVRWFETRRDPFQPIKDEELKSEALWDLLAEAVQAPDLETLFNYALWGNRIDLSYAGSSAQGAGGGELIVDEREQAIGQIREGAGGVIHLIGDNAGTELAMDVLLAARIIDLGHPVVLHLKPHPTFISDATTTDFWRLLLHMAERGGAVGALASKLRKAWAAEKLLLSAHYFWTSPRFLWDMPEALRTVFSEAKLVILKGDANYRRAIGDAVWPPDTPFAAALGGFPAPVVALRTLKSPPIVGLQPGQPLALNRADPEWRTNGKRGVIQYG